MIDEGFHLFRGGIDKFDPDLIEITFMGSDPLDFTLQAERFKELGQREIDLQQCVYRKKCFGYDLNPLERYILCDGKTDFFCGGCIVVGSILKSGLDGDPISLFFPCFSSSFFSHFGRLSIGKSSILPRHGYFTIKSSIEIGKSLFHGLEFLIFLEGRPAEKQHKQALRKDIRLQKCSYFLIFSDGS
jgi:hypothetical protein